jgi:hypothetical protein
MPQLPEALDQIVAPIALYPDALVAQILAASTYPTEVAEADQWMQQHSALTGEELAKAVDQQSWDPSVKTLTQFPSVLANMDRNLSWTSALGNAYANQPQDVLNAVQVMRERAQQAGNLQSTSQETVTTEGQTIVIQPANPQVVYVPEYDPWLIYGDPSRSIQAGFRFREASLTGRPFRSAWALESGSSPRLAGDGTTGAPIGTATAWSTTTKLIADMRVLLMPAGFTADMRLWRTMADFTAVWRTARPASIPARSAVSIMVASRVPLRPTERRGSAEAPMRSSTAAGSMGAGSMAAATGNNGHR